MSFVRLTFRHCRGACMWVAFFGSKLKVELEEVLSPDAGTLSADAFCWRTRVRAVAEPYEILFEGHRPDRRDAAELAAHWLVTQRNAARKAGAA